MKEKGKKSITERYYGKDIVTMIIFEQEPEFYKALKEGDVYKAHLLYQPPWNKPLWMLEGEIKSARLRQEHEKEKEWIKKLPPELHKFDVEFRSKKSK